MKMKENDGISLEIAEFLGWHIGDGGISINNKHHQYTLTGDIVEEYPFYKEIIIPSFNRIFRKYLKNTTELKTYKSVGVCGIYVFSKAFVDMLRKDLNIPIGKKTDIQVPKLIKTLSQKRHFLRRLCDTDGSIYFCKSYVKRKGKSLFNKFHKSFMT